MSNSRRAMLILLVAALLLAWPLGRSMMFVLDPREQAVVLQFGKPVRTRQEPGLYFKIPLIEEVRRLPRTYQFWVGTRGEILENVQTKDGKKVEVTPWAIWRITDPEIFIQKLQTVPAGAARVKTFVRGPMRDVITSNDLAEVVRDDTDRRMEYPLLSDLWESMEEASGDEQRSQGRPVEGGQEGTRELILNEQDLQQIGMTRNLNEQDLEQLGITETGTNCWTDEAYSNIVDSSIGQYSICLYTILDLDNTQVTIELQKFANSEALDGSYQYISQHLFGAKGIISENTYGDQSRFRVNSEDGF